MNDPHERKLNHEELLRQAMADAASDPGTGPGAPPLPDITDLRARFPEFEIVELVGRGGMGAVFKAVQLQLQRAVALKVMPHELGRDPEFGERFLREARALATLSHPGIITVHDFGERDGQFFLVTEFVDGVNLRQLMALGELSPAEALRIAPQICTALQFAHERGIVHRDIKPENILVDTTGRVKIADFGLAKVARPGDPVALTRTTAVFGTPHYMAPEQFRGTAGVDHRADIYAVGVVLYEMLTGQLPIGHFDPPSQRGGVPRGLDEVVRRALAQQPEKRYQHVREVQTDVERHAQDLGSNDASPGAPATAASTTTSAVATPNGRPRLGLGSFAAIAVCILTLAGLAVVQTIAIRERSVEYKYENQFRRYTAEVELTADAIQQGSVPPNPLPVLPDAPPPGLVDGAREVMLMPAIAFGGALLVLALGFGAVRRIRNGNGRFYGLGLAVPVAWAIPLGIAIGLAFAPVTSINNRDLERVTGIAFGALLAAGTVTFLVWEVRRQRRLLAAGVRMPGGGWVATAATLGVLALAFAGSVPGFVPPEPRTVMLPSAMIASELVGESTATVLERLGPPLGITVSRDSTTWSYRDASGATVTDALVVIDGEVQATAPGLVVVRASPRTERPWIGEPLRAFVRRFGTPVQRTTGALATKFRFANGLVVAVHDGIVFRREN